MRNNIVITLAISAIIICIYLVNILLRFNSELSSLSSIRKSSGEFIPPQGLWDIVSNELYNLKFQKPSLILLLGKEGCSPCQVKEMKRLNHIYSQLRTDINIFAIYYNNKSVDLRSDRYEALFLRKVSEASYQIFYTDNPYYRVFGSLPKLIFVHDNMCEFIYYPIQDNSQYSEDDHEFVINDLKAHILRFDNISKE